MIEKTADEMFKELGFIKVEESSFCTTYETLNDCVYFEKETKIYIASDFYRGAIIDIKLHKAITKQIEELGWL